MALDITLKLTFDLDHDPQGGPTLGELRAFLTQAEAHGLRDDQRLRIDLDENDVAEGLSVRLGPQS